MGTVMGRTTDGYRVDIGSAHMASLDGLAFESATKRNKPNLKVQKFFVLFTKTTETFVSFRLGLSYMQECRWRTKIWNLSWNASTHKHVKRKDLEN